MSVLRIILEVSSGAGLERKSWNGILCVSLQALKVESGYICLIVLIFLVSIIPLCYTIVWCFSRNVKLKAVNGVSDMARPAELVFGDEGKEKLDKFHCRKRVLVFILQCLVVLSM